MCRILLRYQEAVKPKVWISVAAALLLTTALTGRMTSSPAVVSAGGRSHAIRIPSPHLALEHSSGKAVYLVLGDGDLHRYLSDHAAEHGWRYQEQMGSEHLLSRENLQLSISRRQQGASFLIELTLQIRSTMPISAP